MLGGVTGLHENTIAFTALQAAGTESDPCGVAKLYGTKSRHLAIRLDEFPVGVTSLAFDKVCKKAKDCEVVPVYPRARLLPVDTPPPLEECYHARISVESDHGLRTALSSQAPTVSADSSRRHVRRRDVGNASRDLDH